MGMIQEFKEFAMKGNVVDLAVGVIMGAAFAPIVSTLVDNIIMPPIGYLMAGVDFSNLAVTLPTPEGDGVAIKYGVFLNALIKFLITADDVIHSWWVPALGWKRDAIPGFINEAWTEVMEPGVYRGQCAELCGKDHGFMPIVLVAKTEEDYQAWVEEQKGAAAAEAASATRTWTMDELMAKGESVYQANCLACHQAGGEGLPAAGFPALKGGKIATGPVAGHLDIVLNGSKQNPAMAAFGQQLSDVDLAAVITYERNAFGNDTGDMVQPADIAAAR